MGGEWRRRVRTGGGPSLNMEPSFHRSNIRRAFNQAYITAGVAGKIGNMTRKQAEKVIMEVYKTAPRVRNVALKYIRGR